MALMRPSSETAWRDPWEWTEFRRMRRGLQRASMMMACAIIAAVPAGWIVMMPADPTLRPDLTNKVAAVVLVICAALAYFGQTTTRKTRARFDQMIYQITRATRGAGIARNVAMEVDLGETYPPTLLSRQQRMMGFGGPTPLLVPMDRIARVEEIYDAAPGHGAAPQPHLRLMLKDAGPDYVAILPGRGFGRSSLEQVRALHERLNEFLDPSLGWETKTAKTVDVRAFIDSMRVR